MTDTLVLWLLCYLLLTGMRTSTRLLRSPLIAWDGVL